MINGKRISLTTGCLNRTDYLVRALDSWLAAPEIDEVVVVDWGNRVPLREALRRFDDPRIVIARVDGQRGWKHSKCHNLEMRLSAGDLILRIDSDCLLGPGFFAAHPVKPGMFYAGNWRLAPGMNEKGLSGTVYLRRSDMLGVGGYNERLLHYGYEDDDFYERLAMAGLSRADLNLGTLSHLHHPDRCRYENEEIEAGLGLPATEKDEHDFLMRLIHKNHVAVDRQRRWSSRDQMTSWRMDWSGDRRSVECVEIVPARAGGIRDVVFRGEDAGASSSLAGEQLDWKSSGSLSLHEENKIYAFGDVKYDEKLVAQVFRAMRMLHGSAAGISAAGGSVHLTESPRYEEKL